MRTPLTEAVQTAYQNWRLAAAIYGEHSAEAESAAGAYVELDTQEKQTIREWAQSHLS